jgi:hypothetical protein
VKNVSDNFIAYNTPYLAWQQYTNGPWSLYGQLPVPAGVHIVGAAAARGNADNLQVVCLGQDGVPYTVWQDHNTGGWAQGANLPVPAGVHIVGAAAAGGWYNAPGYYDYYLEVICVGQDGNAYPVRQDTTGAWTVGPILSIPGSIIVAAAPVPGSINDLEVICLAQNGDPYTAWQNYVNAAWVVKQQPAIPAQATGFVTGNGNNDYLQAIFL